MQKMINRATTTLTVDRSLRDLAKEKKINMTAAFNHMLKVILEVDNTDDNAIREKIDEYKKNITHLEGMLSYNAEQRKIQEEKKHKVIRTMEEDI